jgi:hypothetical protein
MRVVVGVTIAAREDLLALITTRTPTEGDAVEFAALYVADIVQQLREHEGPPPGSRRLRRHGMEEWWWRYADGIWTLFRIADEPGWLFSTTRTITVFAFEPSLPVL